MDSTRFKIKFPLCLFILLLLLLFSSLVGTVAKHHSQSFSAKHKPNKITKLQELQTKKTLEKKGGQHGLAVAKEHYEELLLSLNLNGLPTHEVALFLSDTEKNIWIKEDTLVALRINTFKLPSISYLGAKFYCLKDFKAVKYQLDLQKSLIYLQIPSGYFRNYSLKARDNPILIPQKAPLGGFFNYDFFGQRTKDKDQLASGDFEFGVFNNFGIITSEFLAKHDDETNKFIRLNTTWQIDAPQRMQTLKLGDSISMPGTWGRAVSFGGIQWNRNFSTQSGFIKFPLPAMKGTAVVPSVADVYINNALVTHGSVPAGPFDITNIPVVTGQGDIKLVTTDVLGRQQVVDVPYYASTNILKAGLHDFSFAAGFVREDYGIYSNKYTNFLLSATDDFGVTNKFTATFHGEALDGTQALGIGGNYLLFNYGVLSMSVAGSGASHGKFGGLFMLGFNRQAHFLSYGFSVKVTDKNFRQVGLNDLMPPKAETQAYIAFSAGRAGSFSLSYTGRDNRDQKNERFLTFGYSVNITKKIFFDASAMTNIGGKKNYGIYLTLVTRLGKQTTGSVSFNNNNNNDNNQRQYTAQIQRNLPLGSGYGYNIKANGGDNPYASGGLSLQSSFGTYSGQVAWENSRNLSYQLDASGGVAALNGDVFLSRKINQSFAVVNIPDYKNIPVYLENHEVAKTDRYHNAFIPNLIPYDPNHISVNPNELPMDAQIGGRTKFDVMPYYRSGVVIKLPIQRSRSSTVMVKLPNGKFVPVGASAKIAGQEQDFPVGYDGQLYLTGLRARNRVSIKWDGNSCGFNLLYSTTTNSNIKVKTVVCRGLKHE